MKTTVRHTTSTITEPHTPNPERIADLLARRADIIARLDDIFWLDDEIEEASDIEQAFHLEGIRMADEIRDTHPEAAAVTRIWSSA